MMTPSEYAKNATASLHKVLQISADDFDAEGTAAVIEQVIRNATHEREARAHRQLKQVRDRSTGASGAIVECVTCGHLQLQGHR